MVIKKAEYIISGVSKEHFPKLGYPEFVFIGRSNVGKSSFINALTQRKNLAYTSSKPGKTITLNFFNINDQMIFVDVPGYGYAQKTINDRLKFGKMIEEFLLKADNLRICFLIVDIRHNPTCDDKLMYEYLKHFNLKTAVIATKADKIGKTQVRTQLSNVRKVLQMEKEDLCIAFSSETKLGLEEVYALLENEIK